MPQLFRILDLTLGPRQNECMNRYYFDNPTTEVLTAAQVAQAFLEQHVEAVRFVQSTEWTHTAVFVENVLNAAQSALYTITGGGGAISSDPTPASNAWSYAMKPVGPEIKRGAKRIPGVAESWTDDEVVTSGAPGAAVKALASFFLAPLLVNATTINPVIVRPNLPVNPTQWIVSVVAGAIFRQIGTQVSRKLSRGGGNSSSGLIGYTTGAYTAIDRTGFVEANIEAELATLLATRPAPVTPYEAVRTP